MADIVRFPVDRTVGGPANKGKRKQFMVERDPTAAARTLAQYFGPADLDTLIVRLASYRSGGGIDNAPTD